MRNQVATLCYAASATIAVIPDALIERLQGVRENVSLLYSRIMDSIEYGQEIFKDIVEKETRQEEEEDTEDKFDLTATENEKALKEVHKIFLMSRLQRDSYVDQIKPHIKTLIEDQLKKMQSTRVIMTL